MKSKQDAIQEILEIAKKYNVSLNDLKKVLSSKETRMAATENSKNILIKVFSYLGGIFIFSGIAAYIAMFWATLNSFTRISITLGTGLVLYILGLIFYKKRALPGTIIPLFLLAALFIPTGLFVTIAEYYQGGDARYAALLVFGVMLVHQILTFFIIPRTLFLFTSIIFGLGFFTIWFALLNIPWKISSLTLGLSLLCIAYALGRTKYYALDSFWYLIGSLMLFDGIFELIKDKPFEPVFLVITCLGIYLSTFISNRTLLLINVLAMIAYIGYYTTEHFVNSVGWPISLIVLGFLFFTIGFFALQRLKKMQ